MAKNTKRSQCHRSRAPDNRPDVPVSFFSKMLFVFELMIILLCGWLWSTYHIFQHGLSIHCEHIWNIASGSYILIRKDSTSVLFPTWTHCHGHTLQDSSFQEDVQNKYHSLCGYNFLYSFHNSTRTVPTSSSTKSATAMTSLWCKCGWKGKRWTFILCQHFAIYTNNCQTLKVKVSKPLEQNGALNRRGCLVFVGEISQLLVQHQLSNILLIAKKPFK